MSSREGVKKKEEKEKKMNIDKFGRFQSRQRGRQGQNQMMSHPYSYLFNKITITKEGDVCVNKSKIKEVNVDENPSENDAVNVKYVKEQEKIVKTALLEAMSNVTKNVEGKLDKIAVGNINLNKNIDSKLVNIKNTTLQDVDSKLENIRNIASQDIASLSKNVEDTLANIQKTYTHNLDALKLSIDNKLENISTITSQNVTSLARNVDEKLAAYQNTASQNISSTAYGLDTKIQNGLTRLADIVNENYQEHLRIETEVANKVDIVEGKKLASDTNIVIATINEIVTKLNKIFEDIHGNIEELYHKVEIESVRKDVILREIKAKKNTVMLPIPQLHPTIELGLRLTKIVSDTIKHIKN